jgi:hypothetical protein
MGKPDELYEWWIDVIHDCMCQISGKFELMNPNSGLCRHLCEEVYDDIDIHVNAVITDGYCDVPQDLWQLIVELSKVDDLETADSKVKANKVLDSDYFQNRKRWPYGK